ncbi:hypothetical protein A2763_04225 [Candidatus Kaiserbacteria bacterium RIFCSPHIGHO2_01_FULL_54_36]|uniref:DUF5671 domain-containing protein n=1 Tax=Candidatus Kaiserbacteria bacterium RIFCSPHIGHO2_01_FULL_54_36 TaxID=1798482 RepID=A0A1F6CPD0_9BACT|nr:MAG: hypothetical protein A2763_04225 [Candidatus Kaiserbacteria bacterium RIFCSPHIGHO2_01_FULL_54_36]
MDKPKVTPKDFVLWVGAMATLYSGVFAFISLVFDYINQLFPNPITNSYTYYDPYQTGNISYEMAALIVLTPVFLILMRAIRADIARDSSRREVWVRRWALFLTLALAAGTMVIDLIVLVNTFLQGEDLTAGFLLKVLVVLLVAGAGFLHFLADLRGYWEKEQGRAKMVNYGVGVLVLATIIAGFFIIGTPQEIRAQKQDALRLSDLQNIQWQVVNYWQQKESLPATLDELFDPISGSMIPVDPETKEPYEYTRVSPLDFQLCATFNKEGGYQIGGGRYPVAEPVSMAPGKGIEDNWQHAAGRVCFERSIDPERYPPYSKTR